MSAALHRFRSCIGGASAVEFSIVIVPLLLLVFGSIEFGRYMWTRIALHETAIEAARCMGVKQSECAPSGAYSSTQTMTFVQGKASAWSIAIPSSGVTLNSAATCSGVSGFSQVSIAFTFRTAVPILLGSLRNGVPIQAVACFPNQA